MQTSGSFWNRSAASCMPSQARQGWQRAYSRQGDIHYQFCICNIQRGERFAHNRQPSLLRCRMTTTRMGHTDWEDTFFPSTLGCYQLDGKIGSGTFGEVGNSAFLHL